MAEKTKFEIPVLGTPKAPTDIATPFYYDMVVAAADAANGDNIAVFTPPAGAVFAGCQLQHDATLGAACTAQLRLGATALTAASTAGGASRVLQNAAAAPASGAEKLNVLIGGGDIAAGTTLRVAGFYLLPR